MLVELNLSIAVPVFKWMLPRFQCLEPQINVICKKRSFASLFPCPRTWFPCGCFVHRNFTPAVGGGLPDLRRRGFGTAVGRDSFGVILAHEMMSWCMSNRNGRMLPKKWWKWYETIETVRALNWDTSSKSKRLINYSVRHRLMDFGLKWPKVLSKWLEERWIIPCFRSQASVTLTPAVGTRMEWFPQSENWLASAIMQHDQPIFSCISGNGHGYGA